MAERAGLAEMDGTAAGAVDGLMTEAPLQRRLEPSAAGDSVA